MQLQSACSEVFSLISKSAKKSATNLMTSSIGDGGSHGEVWQVMFEQMLHHQQQMVEKQAELCYHSFRAYAKELPPAAFLEEGYLLPTTQMEEATSPTATMDLSSVTYATEPPRGKLHTVFDNFSTG